MRLLHRPMRLKDVRNCAALLASHPEERRSNGNVLEKVPSGVAGAIARGIDAGRTRIGGPRNWSRVEIRPS
jgi:hypothetical protein